MEIQNYYRGTVIFRSKLLHGQHININKIKYLQNSFDIHI